MVQALRTGNIAKRVEFSHVILRDVEDDKFLPRLTFSDEVHFVSPARWRSDLSLRFSVGRFGVHFPSRVIPKDFKNGICSMTVWRSAQKGVWWGASRQACCVLGQDT